MSLGGFTQSSTSHAVETELYRLQEAADRLRVSHWTLRNWCKARKVVHHRMGVLLMIPRSEVERIIRESVA